LRDRSPQRLWETALGQLELQVTKPNFDTWLRSTVGLRLDGGELVVGAPTDFAIEWLRSRMSPLINRTVSQIAGGEVSVSFQVLGSAALAAPLADTGQAAPAHLPSPAAPQFDPRLTFDSFTVVDSNRLAHRAARRLAAGQATYYPLVLLGRPGLGKTHLLHAIGHQAAGSDKRVLILTGEAFVDRYGKSVRAGHPQAFRDAFVECDLLLLDDLQFLATRPGSQDQFLHIFNILHTVGRQVAVTIDTPPEELSGLSAALSTRLQAGLVARLDLPTEGERLEIVRALLSRRAASLPEAVALLLAEQPSSSIRELEGGLNRVAAYAELVNQPITTEQARQALRPVSNGPRRLSPQTVLDTVCRHFHMTTDQLTGPSRSRDITYARHIAMYLLRPHHPLAEIGRILGNRDHSTVLSGCRRIDKEQASLDQTRHDLADIQASLQTA